VTIITAGDYFVKKRSGKGAVKKVPQKAGCAKRCSLQIFYRERAGSVAESALWWYNLTAHEKPYHQGVFYTNPTEITSGFRKNYQNK
jgi:hypothetical protein